MIPPLSIVPIPSPALPHVAQPADSDGSGPGFADLLALADPPDPGVWSIAPGMGGGTHAVVQPEHSQNLPMPLAQLPVAATAVPLIPAMPAMDETQPLAIMPDTRADAAADPVVNLPVSPVLAPETETAAVLHTPPELVADPGTDAETDAELDTKIDKEIDTATDSHQPPMPRTDIAPAPDALQPAYEPPDETIPDQNGPEADTPKRADGSLSTVTANAMATTGQPVTVGIATPVANATPSPAMGAPMTAAPIAAPELAPAPAGKGVAGAAPAMAVAPTPGKPSTSPAPVLSGPVLPGPDAAAPTPPADTAQPAPAPAAAATTSPIAPQPIPAAVFTLTQPNWPAALAAGPVVALLDLAGGSMVMDLAPDDLGRMTVTVQVQGDTISVRFQTETPEAARLLAEGERQLAAELSRLGMTLAGHDASADRRPTQRGGWGRRSEATLQDGAVMTLPAPVAPGRINLIA